MHVNIITMQCTLSWVYLLYIHYTHISTHTLKRIMIECFGSTCSELPNKSLQAHTTETAPSRLSNYRNTDWSQILLHVPEKNTEMKLGGVNEWTSYISFPSRCSDRVSWTQHPPPQYKSCKWCQRKTAGLVLCGFQISLGEEETTSWKTPWDEADGGRAAALIAPCDSATSLQPIS